jgi:hypothetical protein
VSGQELEQVRHGRVENVPSLGARELDDRPTQETKPGMGVLFRKDHRAGGQQPSQPVSRWHRRDRELLGPGENDPTGEGRD